MNARQAVGRHLSLWAVVVAAVWGIGGLEGRVAVAQGAENPWLGGTRPDLPPTVTDPKVVEEHILQLINQYRAQKGRLPLAIDPKLSVIAKKHAAAMTATGYLYTEDLDERWLEAKAGNKRIVRYAETQAFSFPLKNVSGNVVQEWCRHRRYDGHLIDRDFGITGIGISMDRDGNVFIAQNFAQLAPVVVISGKQEMQDFVEPEPELSAPSTEPSVLDLQ